MKNEKYICNDGKYRYIYKITIIPTNQYYYGQHTLNQNDNDFYMGSGSDLNMIYELSGISCANKEICCYAESENELNYLEKKFIGTKYKDDPLCLNKIPGGNYKRDDNLKHDVAVLGGKAFASKLKTNPEFAKQYKEHQRKIALKNAKDPEFKQKQLEGIKKYLKKSNFKRTPANLKGKDNCHYNKVRIYNDELKRGAFINKNDKLPIGWRYGQQRKYTEEVIYDYKPKSLSYFKCFSLTDCSVIYVKKDCKIPDGYIKPNKGMKGKCRIVNQITKEIRCIPIECNFSYPWKYSKFHK